MLKTPHWLTSAPFYIFYSIPIFVFLLSAPLYIFLFLLQRSPTFLLRVYKFFCSEGNALSLFLGDRYASSTVPCFLFYQCFPCQLKHLQRQLMSLLRLCSSSVNILFLTILLFWIQHCNQFSFQPQNHMAPLISSLGCFSKLPRIPTLSYTLSMALFSFQWSATLGAGG